MRSMPSPPDKIEKSLRRLIKDENLRRLALTHSSYSYRRKDRKSNETLEFLGDAVLELLVREHLFKKYKDADEGQLSVLKKNFTSEDALHLIGKKIGIGRLILMDKGESMTGGRNKRSNITGCLEAIIGAAFLDQGLDAARRFVKRIILNRKIVLRKDYKSLVNNWAMRNQTTLVYKITGEDGPPHRKTFRIALFVNDRKKSEGTGPTKKKAEQMAARLYGKKISLTAVRARRG